MSVFCYYDPICRCKVGFLQKKVVVYNFMCFKRKCTLDFLLGKFITAFDGRIFLLKKKVRHEILVL